MEDFIKKAVYTGVGFLSLARKRSKELVDRLVDEGKLSEKEGQEILDDLKKESDKSREEMEKDFREMLEKSLDKMDIATKKDLEKLEQRITALEMKQNQPEGPAK